MVMLVQDGQKVAGKIRGVNRTIALRQNRWHMQAGRRPVLCRVQADDALAITTEPWCCSYENPETGWFGSS